MNEFKYFDTIEAAEANDFNEVVKMCEAGYDLWRDYENNVCKIAARKGNLDMLVYTYENNEFFFDQEIPKISARYNNVDCLNFCRNLDMGFDDDIITIAAENGSLECLKYLIEKGYRISYDSIVSAARNGQLNTLKYMVENKEPFDELKKTYCCKVSALYGYINTFEYCYSMFSTDEKNNFWKTKYNLNRILPLIDFSKPMWREMLTDTTDRIKIANEDLVALIKQKKEEIRKTIKILNDELADRISTDVINYCIQQYI